MEGGKGDGGSGTIAWEKSSPITSDKGDRSVASIDFK